jgi:hypothetical protein
MDKDASQTEKRPSRPADKPDSRQTEMDARYQEGVVWRNSVRTEDLEWRKATRREDGEVREASRREDREWRESTRKEDKEWREVMRREDLEWRAEVRSEDQQHRQRTERIAKRCAALAAAAQTSKVDSSLDAILALARQFEDWLNSQDK